MGKVNAFDIIKKLSLDGSTKIRLAPLANIITANVNGNKGTFTIGTEPEDVLNYVTKLTGYGGLLLIDKAAYDKAEKELAASSFNQVEQWKAKAEKWDQLAEKVATFYPEDKAEPTGDLEQIGEAAAIAFGFL